MQFCHMGLIKAYSILFYSIYCFLFQSYLDVPYVTC